MWIWPARKRSARAKDGDGPRVGPNESSQVGDFRQLRAWQEAIRFVVLSHPAIRRLPPDERFSLAAQWRRAANSVALNLAEGAARPHPRNFRRRVGIPQGSLDELASIFQAAEAPAFFSGEGIRTMR